MPLPHDTKEKIKAFFKGDVEDMEATLKEYSHDTSLFEVKPSLVVFPKDTEDVKKLVAFVSSEKAKGVDISLTGRSAGTDMTGGPLTENIVVSFTRYMNHVVEVGSHEATSQPGVYYRDFEKQTLAHNLLLPSYPASREICAIGGMVANNSGGEKTLTYGKTEQFVRKLQVVLRDGNEYIFRALPMPELEAKKNLETLEGEIYRKMFDLLDKNYDLLKNAKPPVSKNSSGYYLWNVYDKEKGIFDLTRLIVGSQGTLGLTTEMTFRLIQPKTHSRLLVIFLRDMTHLAELVNSVVAFKPESFESYDDHTVRFAIKLFPMILKRLNGNLFTLALSFIPEAWMALTKGIPKLVLMAEFTGDSDDEALRKAQAAQEGIRNFHVVSKVTANAADANKYWVMRRESFNLLRQRSTHLRTAPFIDDIIVAPQYLPEFLPKLYDLLDGYNIIYTVAGHMGDGNFHIIPLMDMTDPKSLEIITELSRKVFALIREFHGSNTAEHNDGLIRTYYLKEQYGEAVYKLFEETKRIFDPDNIFNPGKKVDGTWEYARAHIDTK